MLSVGEILKTECFREARLLTEIDINKQAIGSVTVGEVPDIAQWLTGGEMVLTTLFSARDVGSEKLEIVEGIISSSAGALVVKLGRFVESLPPYIINMASEKGFPIISLPAGIRWTNVIAEVYKLLSMRELDKLTWLESVRQQFSRITAGEGGLTSIANTLSGLIGCRVIIEDLIGGMLAQSSEERSKDPGPGDQADIDPTFDQLGKNSNIYRIEQNISPNSYLYYTISKQKNPTYTKYAFELDDGHDNCGYLVALADDPDDAAEPIDATQVLAIEKAVEAANIEMSRMRASINAEMRLMGNLFTLLNSGSLTTQQAISRASFLHIDLSAGFIVCILDLVHAVEDAGSRTIEQVMERAFGIARRVVTAYFPGSLVALDGRRINILLVPPAGTEPTVRPKLIGSTIEKIVKALDDSISKAGFRVGVSSYHRDAAEVNIAYNEATTAALISTATGKTGGISNFRDLGLYKLLLLINRSHPEDARKFYLDTLGPVEEYDRKREGELMHTLEVFFDLAENINETAIRLFTHRHTIRYRLQRIAELTGLDPFDPDDRELFRVAIKLRQLAKL